MAAIDGWVVYNAALMAINALISTCWALQSARVAHDPSVSLSSGPLALRHADPIPADWRWVVVWWLSAKSGFFWLIALAVVTPIPRPVGETGLTGFTLIHAYTFWRWLCLPPATARPGPPLAESFRQ